MSNFEITRTITEDDIPLQNTHKRSKYDPILKSCKTLEVDEGIEVAIEKKGTASTVRKLLTNRHQHRFYEVCHRSRPEGLFMYIVRKQ